MQEDREGVGWESNVLNDAVLSNYNQALYCLETEGILAEFGEKMRNKIMLEDETFLLHVNIS